MQTFFLICTGIGGTLVVLQFLSEAMGFFSDVEMDTADVDDGGGGMGGDGHDGHVGHGNVFFGLLTFRAVCAAVTFFGLGGLTAGYYGSEPIGQFPVALGAGAAALYLVAAIMRLLYRLRADGTVRIQHAVGVLGTVYLRIPAMRQGPGKVTLTLQNRTVELEALTAGGELPTGTPIRIVTVLGPNTVEVVHANAEIAT